MKKTFVAAALVSAFFSISALAQSTNPGSLLFPGSTDSTLLNWGTDTVNEFLGAHQIPSSEWTAIQQYGRQDVYDNLRSYAWISIQNLITSQPGTLTPTQQYVLDKFIADANTLNIAPLQNAVNAKNAYLANKCTWQPDPTIATAAGYSYNGSDYCPAVGWDPSQFTGPPAISPPVQYFTAYGQKTAWIDPISSRPGGTVSMSHITQGGILLLGLGISVAVLLGLGLGIALSFKVVYVALLPFAESAYAFGYIGTGIVVALALILIVVVIFVYTENARVESEYSQLDSALMSAQSSPISQSAAASLLATQAGHQLLYSVFLNEFVPSVSVVSSAPLPTPNPPIDPEFVIGQVANPSIQFKGWVGETYTLSLWHGWFISTVNKTVPGVDSPSINTRIHYLWNGAKYEAARSGATFIAAKVKTAATDVDCPPIPATGVSAPTDFTKCKSFTTTSLPMDLTTGTQSVSLYQAPAIIPATDNFSPTWTDGFAIGQPRQVALTATGIPAPAIRVGPSGLPAGFALYSIEPGSAILSWDGTGTAGPYSIPFQATNGPGSTTATMNATVYNAVKFVQPGLTSNVSLNLYAGTPYSIQVVAVGSPAPQLTAYTLDACGLSVPASTTNPTFTMSGTIRPPSFLADAVACVIDVEASNANRFINDNACGCGYDHVRITITVSQPPSEPVLVTKTATAPVWQTTQTTIATSGGTGTVQISLTQGSGGQLAPPWVSLNDNGNGTATLTMTPPPDAPDTVLVPLWYRVANTPGNQATSSTDGVTVTVNKKPVFSSVPDTGYIFVASNAAFTNQSQPFYLTNLSGSLGPADPLPPALSLTYFPYTGTLQLQGPSRQPGYYQSSLVATNSYGSSTAPIKIVSLQPANITSAARVNFYIGQTTTFKLKATGFPQSHLTGIPDGMADPLRFSGTPSDPGIKLQTSDPSTGTPYYGYAVLTGVPQSGYGVYPFPISAQTGNNTSLSPINQQNFQLVVTYPGDVNGDGVVNCSDITYITSRYGQMAGMANYDYNADYNHDGVINVKDTALALAYLPKGTPRCQ